MLTGKSTSMFLFEWTLVGESSLVMPALIEIDRSLVCSCYCLVILVSLPMSNILLL